MAKPLNRTIEEYIKNNGWSSSLFLGHAKFLFDSLKDKAHFKIGRTVIHVISETKTIKFYVHHNGKSKEYMTITDANGDELKTYHYLDPINPILKDVKLFLEIQ